MHQPNWVLWKKIRVYGLHNELIRNKVGVSLKFESRNHPISLRHANSLSMSNFNAYRYNLKKFNVGPIHMSLLLASSIFMVLIKKSMKNRDFSSQLWCKYIVPHSLFLDHGVVPKIHYFCTKHTNGIKCPTQKPN